VNVVDLFAGLGGGTQAFRDRGHHVWTTDIDPKFGCDLTADILDLGPEDFDQPRFIWASPPCEKFSIASGFGAWGPGYDPTSDEAKFAIQLVEHAVYLIEVLNPKYFVIENPMGLLRKLDLIPYPRQTITQCQYHRLDEPGPTRMKPTDLWGRFPASLRLFPPCKNGAACHVRAPRGSQTGTQGMTAVESGKIPYLLGMQFCLAAEYEEGIAA